MPTWIGFSFFGWTELRFKVDAPIPQHEPIGNLQGIGILTRLGVIFDQVGGLSFNWAGTNSAATHVLADSSHWDDVRVNFWLQIFHSNFNVRNKIINRNPLDFYRPTWEYFAPPYTSPDVVQNILSDR